ncbi:hypothetical protein LEP1GSC064_0586 [Leptospira kirschneri serovar Grippotyphosa str. Moskva]|uniref:Uncharacterized protein n=1 Tax=Leptospira kirschneri str. 200802841 TaxID=1193047 RepID=A0A828Y338_9LEPT|nr:hypothetical protein LEP1GSC131_0025 [Leptospira kirschneri str. 200802841]EKQ85476.1 hypothetical protein LEP1GSC064_0586 [Leptospira kirschneri serovar Grippotyphosa str. Moskva]EKR09420.1 hypothetical protein LEP1GSC122_0196 [Leptospira kirschneri serovar Valbuzzi str. 200702274]EMK02171.1 hypothetical protein LEP1GSC176_1811 [Leptospira kirschneri str. MMD1493]EMN26869.1 hypothetical protein LEP1GSC065_2571 [Leptospira kirschneri serovar Sokoine str. RM1]
MRFCMSSYIFFIEKLNLKPVSNLVWELPRNFGITILLRIL